MRSIPLPALATALLLGVAGVAAAQQQSGQTQTMPGMDHSQTRGMDHSRMPGMNHSNMPGMRGTGTQEKGQGSGGQATRAPTKATRPDATPR